MGNIYFAIGITFIGVVLSAFYSGLETGLYTINRIRLDVRASTKLASALRLRRFIDHPIRMLAVLLVCNNVANYLATYGTARMLEETTLGPWTAILVNSVVMIPVLFIFGEVLPKDLFRTHTDSWTYTCSAPLSISDKLLWWSGVVPILSLVGKLGSKFLGTETSFEPSPRRRFGLLFKEGLEGGILSNEQITLADRVLGMKSLTVQSEMVPWSRVLWIDENISHNRRTSAICNTTHTRLPVVNSQGTVEGVLPVLDALLRPKEETTDLLTPPMFFKPQTPVREALQSLRKSGTAMAIVTSPKNKPIGVVTLKDLVEPIVGELSEW